MDGLDNIPDETLRAVLDGEITVDEALFGDNGEGGRPCPLVPCAAFMDGPSEVSWLVDELVPEAALVVVYADPKGLKSTFTTNLALAQATSRPFLRRESRGGRVGIIQLEDPPVLVRNRLKTMCDFVPDGVFVSAGKAWGEVERLRLAEYIKALSLQLVVIDPLILWKPGTRENVAEEVGVLMYSLRQVVQETGCTVVVVHHSRKSGGDYGEGMRGSNAILGACDVAIELQKKEPGEAIMRVTSRLSTVEDERIELDPETLTLFSLGPAAGAKVKQRQAEILRAIRTAGPIGATELQKDLEVNKATLQRDLKAMKKSGQIEAEEETLPRGGKRFLYVVSERRLTPLKGGVSETTRHLTLDCEE